MIYNYSLEIPTLIQFYVNMVKMRVYETRTCRIIRPFLIGAEMKIILRKKYSRDLIKIRNMYAAKDPKVEIRLKPVHMSLIISSPSSGPRVKACRFFCPGVLAT